MPKFPYNFFDDFIVRLPHLSFKEFKRNFYEKCTDDENIEKYLTSIIFREAIYLVIPKNKYNDLIFNILLSNFA